MNLKRKKFMEQMAKDMARTLIEGGEGSGHWQHAGRPGYVGGSSKEDSATGTGARTSISGSNLKKGLDLAINPQSGMTLDQSQSEGLKLLGISQDISLDPATLSSQIRDAVISKYGTKVAFEDLKIGDIFGVRISGEGGTTVDIGKLTKIGRTWADVGKDIFFKDATNTTQRIRPDETAQYYKLNVSGDF